MKKTVKILATAIVLIVCAMFVLRCCMAADKSKFSSLDATDELKAAYSDGASETYTVKMSREMSEDGYFSAYAFYFNRECSEVQLAVRWNDSAYGYTGMEAGHEFAFYIYNETTGEKYPAEAVGEYSFSMYNYRKLVAHGVSLEDNEQLVAVMELRDGYESRQVIKYAEQPLREYKPGGGFMKNITK